MNTFPVIYDHDPLLEIFIRLGVEVSVLIIIIPVIYRKFTQRKEHMFPFFLMGIIIFTLCALLQKVEIQMGMVLGLFAIFSIIRFRTVNFSTKDMSYLFTILGLSAINAMLNFPHPIRGTIIFNSIIILTILLLELGFKDEGEAAAVKGGKKGKKKKEKKEDRGNARKGHIVIYDNLPLLARDKLDELIRDISFRTGMDIEAVRIRKIDLTSGNAELEVFLRENPITGEQ